jgi:Protein of unknown function (DUF3421)
MGSSSDESSDSGKHKHKYKWKGKKHKKDKAQGAHGNFIAGNQHYQHQLAPVHAPGDHAPGPVLQPAPVQHALQVDHKNYEQFSSPPIVPPHFDPHPPAYQNSPSAVASTRDSPVSPPSASGYRIPLTTAAPFPDLSQAGHPPCYDVNGSPIFIGSALFEKSVQPCKIGPHLSPFALVAFGGLEHGHHGRYDLLPFSPQTMEFVPTSHGRIPQGRRPIDGGYEEHGGKLYHAVAYVNGVRVPGKTGEHLYVISGLPV